MFRRLSEPMSIATGQAAGGHASRQVVEYCTLEIPLCEGGLSTQAVHALRSGEAEYYAALKGACDAVGFQSMLKDLGLKATVTLFADSSAARGIIHRERLGKLRRLETRYLWLQAAVKNKRLQARKALGTENPADLLTTHLGAADMLKHLPTLHMSPEEGRTSAAPGI